MKSPGLFILLFVILAGLVISAGCSSAPSPGNAGTTTITPVPATITGTPGPVTFTVQIPQTAETAVLIPVAQTNTTRPSPAPTRVQTTYGATGDPRIIILQFWKEYFNADLPDCGMKASFPDAAGDPDYGISGRRARLVAYTEEQMREFLTANAIMNVSRIRADRSITDFIDPNILGGAPCTGTVSTPTWNFVLINATIIGRNARPSEYAIGFNVRSKGTVVAQIRADRNLTLDEPSLFALYIPLKTDETELFDSVEMIFSRKG